MGDWNDMLSAVKARLRQAAAEFTESPINGSVGRAETSVLECVSALDQLQKTLEHELGRFQQLAERDGLTSLPNRSFFRQRLADALAQPPGRTLAVLYLDLDGFKAINDAHGHDAGDELLRIVALRLARSVRAADMVSRVGGDEFACLISDRLDRPQLQHLACKLFDAVSAPLRIGALQLTVHPSIGIALCPADGSTTEGLLKNADAAMYRAKRHQSGYAFFGELEPPPVTKPGPTSTLRLEP